MPAWHGCVPDRPGARGGRRRDVPGYDRPGAAQPDGHPDGAGGMTVDRFSELIVARRRLVILAAVAAVLALAYGGRFLSFHADTREFFSRENPLVLALEVHENTFAKEDHLMFVLAPTDGNVFTRETLAAVEELTEASWQVPHSSRINSLTNFQHIEADGDDLRIFPLVQDASSLSGDDIERIRDIALGSPELSGRLVSKDGAVTAVSAALPGKQGGDVETAVQIAVYARELAASFEERHPHIDVHIAGSVMFDAAFMEVPQREMQYLVPLMLLLLLAIVGLGLRSLWGTVGTLLVILMSVGAALGASGWVGVVLKAGNASAIIIILTLSVANCVHVISTMQLARRDGASRHRAITDSLRINTSPMVVTSVTTAIGFLSMNFSDAPPFRTLGNIAAAGVMIAFVLSLTFLPAFLAAMPSRIRPGQARSRLAMEAFAEFLIAYRWFVLWGVGAVIAVLVLGIGRISLDDNFSTYFGEEYEVRQAADFTEKNLIGDTYLAYSLPAGGNDAITEPAYLADMEDLAAWFRAQPEVKHVSTFSDIVKTLHRKMNGDSLDYFRLPESRETAAQYLLLYELSLPQGFDLNDRIDIAKSSTRFSVSVSRISSVALRELDRRAQAWMSANTPSLRSPATGLPIVYASLTERNVRAMLLGNVVALTLISFVLIFALRSLKMGLISLIPNLMPAAITFGMWGYINGEVGLAISTVMGITLGIVVDDTVHFLSKYLRARREHHMSASMAGLFAFGTVGPALWITSLALFAGFCVLGLSGFKVNSEMGLLNAATIAFALATDFFILPPLLMWLDRK